MILLLFGIVNLVNLFGGIVACGYESCPSNYDPNKLHLHIIAHSHDDVGWLFTPDHYAESDVSPMLSHVLQSLEKNKQRKFVEVEMYFFKRWWQRQPKEVHDRVHSAVKSGQLSFANGGWCINDEATTHYNQIIDQMTLGIEFLRTEFGECAVPKLSWQIDPFGASQEQANLFAQMGFDAHVTNRGNGNLKGEFMWNTSLGHSIFTTHLHAHYSAPDGLNFENGNNITDQNKHEKANKLVALGKQWNRDYGSKGHVLIPFGDDFQYKNSENWFANLDKLIETVIAEHSDVHLFYSSPQCYIKAVMDTKPKLETKSGDYHPYWTGYYSSRPQVKYLDRYVNNLLQAGKQLEVIAGLGNTQSLLWEGKNQMGVLQHHDAVTGTSPVNIMIDYKQRAVSAIKAIKTVISQALERLIHKKPLTGHSNQPFVYTTVNISDFVDHLASPVGFAAIIYNPLGQAQSKSWIRIPVSQASGYKVHDLEGKEVKSISIVPISPKVLSLIGHHEEISHELVFETDLPALGFTTLFVTKESATVLHENSQKLDVNANHDFILKGKEIELEVNHKTGDLISLTKNRQKHKLVQNFAYYDSVSDAYEFCPKAMPAHIVNDASSVVVHAAKYDGFSEITQKVTDWIWQTVRVYSDKDYVELDWVVGPVSEGEKHDKEVVTRFETDLKNDRIFYTDSNGRQMMERHRSDQVHECHGTHQTVTYNYYPVTTKATLKDKGSGLELILLPDRSVGASSLKDGQLELMVHRRIYDRPNGGIVTDDRDVDGRGVVTRGKFLLFLAGKEESADDQRQTSRSISLAPIVAFQSIDTSIEQYKEQYNLAYTALRSPLPPNVHLLTLENWGSVEQNQVLVRFENFYDRNDASKLSSSAHLSLNAFADIQTENIQKANLVAGHLIALESKELVLEPQEITTLVYKVKRNISGSVCSFKWEKLASNRKVPEHAIVAGHESDQFTPLYICRHKNVDLIPGKYNDGLHCHISFGGRELEFNDADVELLVSDSVSNYQWVPRHGGDPFAGKAFVAGTKGDGVPLYIGRCHKNGLVVGKIDEYFYYPYSGAEQKDCVDHEILAC